MMRNKIVGFLLIADVLVIAYCLGPRPSFPRYQVKLPNVPVSTLAVEKYINDKEKALPVKAENEARIVWANDSLKQVTPYVLIYLHGFGACSKEGDPVHKDIARKFGCNLLLTRLSDHGLISKEPMKDLTTDRLWDSALEAYALGKRLGKRIILMGTSTGGTLALKMAAEFPDIAAIILFSPNIEVNNNQAWILNNPWGLQLAREIFHGKEIVIPGKEAYYKKYWYNHYRIEGVVQLEEMIETSMIRETFAKVKQPVLLLYYFRDEIHQDRVVKVDAMLKMFDELGTPAPLKMKFPVPGAGDHVIGCSLRSKDIITVEKYSSLFMQKILASHK